MLKNQSRYIAEKVNELAEKDPALAARVAYEVLPDFNDKSHPQAQYTPEADFAFRKALSYEGGTTPLNVQPVAIFPDGKKILARDGDNLCILDSEDKMNRVKSINGPFPPNNRYSISQDGSTIATYTTRHSICILGVESDLVFYDTIPDLDDFTLDPTGSHIVSKNGSVVCIYDDKGFRLKTLSLPSYVWLASYSPSGKWIITSCNEGIFIWDSQTGLCVDTLIGTYGTVFNKPHDRAIFDQNEQTIATWKSYGGQGIILWNWNSNSAKSDSTNAQTILDVKYIESISFSPDGRYFITNGYTSKYDAKNQEYDNYIQLWSISSYSALPPIRTIKKTTPQNIALTAFPSNDRILYFYKDGKDAVYAQVNYLDYKNSYYTSFESHNPLKYKDIFSYANRFGGINTALFGPDGKCVLVGTVGGLFLIDVQTGDVIKRIGNKASFASFSPDGNYVAYAFDSVLCVCDSLGQNELFRKELNNNIQGVTFSPDSKSIVSMSEKSCIFWDIQTKEPINEIPSLYSKFSKICFNHYATDAVLTNGQIGETSSIKFHHVKDRKFSKYVSYYPTQPGTVSFSPDDKYLASISKEGISVWKYKEQKSLLSKDNRYHASQDSPIEQQEPWLFIKGRGFTTLDYSPDGKYLIACSSGCSYIYDAYRGVELCKLSDGRLASFSPDGKKILSISYNTIRIWDFPSLQDLIDQNREHIKDRPLTAEERRLYYLE